MRDRFDLGAALLKPARERILEALKKERQARKMERKLRRQAEGEVRILEAKFQDLQTEISRMEASAANPIRPRM